MALNMASTCCLIVTFLAAASVAHADKQGMFALHSNNSTYTLVLQPGPSNTSIIVCDVTAQHDSLGCGIFTAMGGKGCPENAVFTTQSAWTPGASMTGIYQFDSATNATLMVPPVNAAAATAARGLLEQEATVQGNLGAIINNSAPNHLNDFASLQDVTKSNTPVQAVPTAQVVVQDSAKPASTTTRGLIEVQDSAKPASTTPRGLIKSDEPCIESPECGGLLVTKLPETASKRSRKLQEAVAWNGGGGVHAVSGNDKEESAHPPRKLLERAAAMDSGNPCLDNNSDIPCYASSGNSGAA